MGGGGGVYGAGGPGEAGSADGPDGEEGVVDAGAGEDLEVFGDLSRKGGFGVVRSHARAECEVWGVGVNLIALVGCSSKGGRRYDGGERKSVGSGCRADEDILTLPVLRRIYDEHQAIPHALTKAEANPRVCRRAHVQKHIALFMCV